LFHKSQFDQFVLLSKARNFQFPKPKVAFSPERPPNPRKFTTDSRVGKDGHRFLPEFGEFF
jgi:hypothetical protein